MGYLFHILAAAAIQALGEADLVAGWRLPWGVLALACLPHLLARRANALALRGAFRRADLCARLVQLSPVPMHAAAVVLFGWVQSARDWTGAELLLFGWPRPVLAIALAPFVIYELIAIDAYSGLHAPSPRERHGIRNFQIRMFLAALAPLACYLVLASLVGWSEGLRVRIKRVALYHALFVSSLLLVLAAFLPTMLRNTWETAPIGPGPIRDLFQAVASRAQFRARSLLMWKTSHLMANAMIVGLFARNRVVLFSDSLLAMLGPRELAAVFAHEIGHAKRRHVTIFLTWIAAFFLGGDMLVSQAGLVSAWGSAGAAIGLFVLWFLVFGWLSRRFELEADLYALELLGDPLGLIAALERVGGRLRDVAGWRHFSTAGRVAFLSRAAADSGFVRRFRALLRRVTFLGAVLAIGTAILEVYALARSWPADQVVVELSFGEYGRAVERARGIELEDEWLAALVDEAGTLASQLGPHVAREALAAELEASLSRGDPSRALAQAELLDLGGDPRARSLALVLEALASGDVSLARDELAGVPAEWRALAEPLVESTPER